MIDERGGRGLSVGAGDADHLRMGIASCKLYLADDMDAFPDGLHNHWGCLRDARTLDDFIGIKDLLFCMLALFPLDMVVVEHLLVFVGNLRHV